MLGGETIRTVFELLGKGESIRGMAAEMGISRNTLRKYLRSPGVPTAKKRCKRARLLDPFESYLRQPLAGGVENSVVLLREIKARGYQGGYSTLKEFLRPLRRGRRVKATVRFETLPGEQARAHLAFPFRVGGWQDTPRMGVRHGIELESCSLRWVCAEGRHSHLHSLPRERLQPLWRISKRCLYDNTKTVVLERSAEGQTHFNVRFLDLAASRLRNPALPSLPGSYQRSGGVRHQVPALQLLANGALCGPGRPEPPSASVNEDCC